VQPWLWYKRYSIQQLNSVIESLSFAQPDLPTRVLIIRELRRVRECALREKLEYDSFMRRLSASVAVFALGAVVLVLNPSAQAQIHGTPPSVTSVNFGGHYHFGAPASVTSLGPQGYTPRGQFFRGPNCCINPLFPVNPNPPRHSRRYRYGYGYGGYGAAYPVVVPVYEVPYDEEVVGEQPEEPPVDNSAGGDEYRGGPTIFDRRGPGTPVRPPVDDYANNAPPASQTVATQPAAPAPAEDQPQTVLVFKDGHQLEVQNYAIVGSDLYDLTPGRRHKIALADLNLAATAKENDDRGIDFQLPAN
jgi:hypothetical protein